MASFSEEAAHPCHSRFSTTIQVCGADHSIAGQYQLMIIREGKREEVDGTMVTLKMNSLSAVKGKCASLSTLPHSLTHSLTPSIPLSLPHSLSLSPSLLPSLPLFLGSKDETAITAAYATPVVVLVMACLLVALAILVVLRLKKRRRMGRTNGRVQSPIIKEISFMKKDSEAILMSPLSPQRSDLQVAAAIQDPLEFPRNRLYITNKILGGLQGQLRLCVAVWGWNELCYESYQNV